MKCKVIPPATADCLSCSNIAKEFFFFESLGTTFRIRDVSCGSRHKGSVNISVVPFKRVVSMWLKSKMFRLVSRAIRVHFNQNFYIEVVIMIIRNMCHLIFRENYFMKFFVVHVITIYGKTKPVNEIRKIN